MADVFVSYARPDRERVQSLAAALEASGFSVWWDREILAGSEFEQVIQTELDRASCVLVAWSSTSVASAWVRNEANEGLKRKALLPVILDDTTPPLAFRHIQSVSLANEFPVRVDSPAFADLRRALATLIGRPDRNEPRVAREHPVQKLDPIADRPGPARRSPLLAIAAAVIVVGLLGGYFAFFRIADVPPTSQDQDRIEEGNDPPADAPKPAPENGTERGRERPAPRPPDGNDAGRKDTLRKDTARKDTPPPEQPERDRPPEQPDPVPAAKALKDFIRAGQPFEVEFDALREPIGTIRPQGRYEVAYLPREQSWKASGPMFPAGTQDDVVLPGTGVCDPDRSALCIWGAAFRFDDEGQVFYIGTRRVGRIHR